MHLPDKSIMAAVDTYEWYIATSVKNRTPDMLRLIGEQRAYLFSLRSEDERQRFVDAAMEELRELVVHA